MRSKARVYRASTARISDSSSRRRRTASRSTSIGTSSVTSSSFRRRACSRPSLRQRCRLPSPEQPAPVLLDQLVAVVEHVPYLAERAVLGSDDVQQITPSAGAVLGGLDQRTGVPVVAELMRNERFVSLRLDRIPPLRSRPSGPETDVFTILGPTRLDQFIALVHVREQGVSDVKLLDGDVVLSRQFQGSSRSRSPPQRRLAPVSRSKKCRRSGWTATRKTCPLSAGMSALMRATIGTRWSVASRSRVSRTATSVSEATSSTASVRTGSALTSRWTSWSAPSISASVTLPSSTNDASFGVAGPRKSGRIPTATARPVESAMLLCRPAH